MVDFKIQALINHYVFTEQIYLEHILYTRNCSKHLRYISKENRQKAMPSRDLHSGGIPKTKFKTPTV